MKDKFIAVFSNQVFLHFISYVTLILSIVTFYANFTEFNFNSSFNSDALGVINLFRDLFDDGGSLQSWRMPGSTTLFPDMILFYLLFQVFGTNVLALTFTYGVLQVILITLILCYIFRKLFQNSLKQYSWLIPLLFSLIFLESYYGSRDQMLPYLLTIYCYHTGTLVNTLIGIAISISNIKIIYKAVILLVLSFLAAFSDLLFVVMFVAPFFLINIIQYKYLGIKQALICFVCVITGVYLGNYLFNYLNEIGYIIYTLNIKLYSFDSILNSWNVFYNQMNYYIHLNSILAFHVLYTIVSLFLVPASALLFRNKLDIGVKYFLWLFIFISFSLILSPIVNGIYINIDSIRYNAAIFYFSLTTMAIMLAVVLHLWIKPRAVKSMFNALIIITMFSFILYKLSVDGVKNYFTYYPPKVKALDSICEKHNLKNGISDYWNAKWSTMFSKKNIKVHAVYQWTNIYEFGSNLEWYYGKEFDFIIPDRLDSSEIRKYFTIMDSIKSPALLLLKTKKYYYPREGNGMPKTIETSD